MTHKNSTEQIRTQVEDIYRTESRRIFATLIRLLGDFDLAEDAIHDAFRVAMEKWPREGVPANPRAWLVSTGRFKAIDALRRRARFDSSLADLAEQLARDTDNAQGQNDEDIEDDRLRLIFTCCHPALSPEARMALTLREVCGLTTEAMGLLALMLLHESRRAARTSAEGNLIVLEEQDRSSWNQELIAEGTALVERALSSDSVGAYTLQAAIAVVHAIAPDFAATDWAQIVSLYDMLLQVMPSPIVEINRAVAIAMRDDLAIGLELIDAILARGDLVNYHLAHAARADLYRRLGEIDEAQASYQQALTFAQQEPERRFLEQRIASLENEF